MVLEIFEPTRLIITEFLNTQIGIFDYWSLVHLFVGFLLMGFLIKKFKPKREFLFLGFMLILYEFVELFSISNGIMYSGLPLFKTESMFNVISDIIFGLFGGWLYFKK